MLLGLYCPKHITGPWTMDEVYIGTISHIDNTHESRQATERSNHVIEKK